MSLPNELQEQHTEGLGVESYSYDGYGNTTSLSATDALTSTYGVSDTIGYDSHARPVSIRVKSQAYSTVKQAVFSTVSFGYNAQGQRSSYSVSTPGYPGYRASYRYRDDGPNVAQAVVASGTVTGTVDYTDTYLYDQNGLPYELLRQYQGQPIQRYWYEEDGQGDVVALTDINGNVVDRYAYDPWGEGLAGTVSEQVPQPLRYRGYWWDTELGWYWVNVRSLDPEGRWLQPDPSQADGVRTYAYLGDDPVDGADPSGQQGGAVAAGAGAVCVGTIEIPLLREIDCAAAIAIVGIAFVEAFISDHHTSAHIRITRPSRSHSTAATHAVTWSPTGTTTIRVRGREYIVGAYREVRKLDPNTRRGSQVHHIIQDAACESDDGSCKISPNYSTYDAPTVLLRGGSTLRGSQHDRANRAQYAGGNGTYGGEREVGYRALIAGGIPPLVAGILILYADTYFIGHLQLNYNSPTCPVYGR